MRRFDIRTAGGAQFDGTRIDKVEKGDDWIRVWRGKGKSFMESWVMKGDLDVKVGLGPE
jgi:hypothetical protein